MHANTILSRAAALTAAAIITVGLSGAAQAATDFTGTLGFAANRFGWAAGKRFALINWNGGWSTKLVKRGDHFKKLAYAPGQAPKGKPASKALAVKVQ